MTQVLVTGANGHVGSNLVRHLLEQGHTVRALVRRGSDLRGLDGLDLDRFYGDVLDLESVEPAVDGCEIVFHLAAPYNTRAKNAADVIRPSVEGTRNVLAAAKEAGVRRVVHTSSVAAIGYTDSPEKSLDETDWYDAGPRLAYHSAKVDSERKVHELAKQLGVEVVVVCPAWVLGGFDYRITPSTLYIRNLLNRSAFTGSMVLNLIDVRDVARGHLFALERGRAGERYILGGEHVDGRRLGELLGEISGKAPRHLPTPRWMALAAVALLELAARLLRREPTITVSEASIHANRYAVYDLSKAREELGFEAQPAQVALESAASWLAHIGALDPSVASRIRDRLPPDPSWGAPS